MTIEPLRYYRPQDPELRQIAAVQTLAAWRYRLYGPAFTRSGSRVLYKGADLIAWLEAQRVETTSEGD